MLYRDEIDSKGEGSLAETVTSQNLPLKANLMMVSIFVG